MTTPRLSFAGRKLIGLVICVAGMVFTACTTLSLIATSMLDGAFAQNLTITVVGGIGTLYATFCGANYGEHYAKNKFMTERGEPMSPDPENGSATPPRPTSPPPEEEVTDPPTQP